MSNIGSITGLRFSVTLALKKYNSNLYMYLRFLFYCEQ